MKGRAPRWRISSTQKHGAHKTMITDTMNPTALESGNKASFAEILVDRSNDERSLALSGESLNTEYVSFDVVAPGLKYHRYLSVI